MPPTDEQLQELAEGILHQLLVDMTDRGGWRQFWNAFGYEARKKIRNDWQKMIFTRLRGFRDVVE